MNVRVGGPGSEELGESSRTLRPHFAGVAGAGGQAVRRNKEGEGSGSESLLRPLEAYAEIVGGGW